MFFVGATGHLLTLILTVCLPVVFLFAAKPDLVVSHDVIVSENHRISADNSSMNFVQAEIDLDFVAEKNEIHFDFENQVIQKIPLPDIVGSYHQFYIQSSGNKAPPRFYC